MAIRIPPLFFWKPPWTLRARWSATELFPARIDTAVQKQIDQVLLFSRFRPELSFGVPMAGGRVLLSFNEVHVHG